MYACMYVCIYVHHSSRVGSAEDGYSQNTSTMYETDDDDDDDDD